MTTVVPEETSGWRVAWTLPAAKSWKNWTLIEASPRPFATALDVAPNAVTSTESRVSVMVTWLAWSDRVTPFTITRASVRMLIAMSCSCFWVVVLLGGLLGRGLLHGIGPLEDGAGEQGRLVLHREREVDDVALLASGVVVHQHPVRARHDLQVAGG